MSDNQTTLFSDNPEYDAFVEKFKRKKTTDDCYTPENIYNAVADWVADEYHLDRACFVRPFYPGGDYQNYTYPPECVVVDNPPFSIYTKILRWYQAHNIRFFLFAPAKTLFVDVPGVCFLPTAVTMIFENGADIRISFATNLDRYRVRTAPDLHEIADAANRHNVGDKTFPKYIYPDNVITAAIVQKLSVQGVDFRVAPEDCVFTRTLDSMRGAKKGLYGGGFLISDRAAQDWKDAKAESFERVVQKAYEKAHEKAHEKETGTIWTLSEREMAIVRSLGDNKKGAADVPDL